MLSMTKFIPSSSHTNFSGLEEAFFTSDFKDSKSLVHDVLLVCKMLENYLLPVDVSGSHLTSACFEELVSAFKDAIGLL